jgi:hypothetical protein
MALHVLHGPAWTRSNIIIYRTGGNYFGLDIILERRGGGIVGNDLGQDSQHKKKDGATLTRSRARIAHQTPKIKTTSYPRFKHPPLDFHIGTPGFFCV